MPFGFWTATTRRLILENRQLMRGESVLDFGSRFSARPNLTPLSDE